MAHRDAIPSYSMTAKSLSLGETYQHYSGKQYRILFIARHSETLEEMVVYQALYGDQNVWTRPLDMFLESIMLDGEIVPRFKRINLLDSELDLF